MLFVINLIIFTQRDEFYYSVNYVRFCLQVSQIKARKIFLRNWHSVCVCVNVGTSNNI